MGMLEDRIVASLVTLCESEPDCARAMFVLPTSRMVLEGTRWTDGLRIVRDGDVAMVCRTPDACETSPL